MQRGVIYWYIGLSCSFISVKHPLLVSCPCSSVGLEGRAWGGGAGELQKGLALFVVKCLFGCYHTSVHLHGTLDPKAKLLFYCWYTTVCVCSFVVLAEFDCQGQIEMGHGIVTSLRVVTDVSGVGRV